MIRIVIVDDHPVVRDGLVGQISTQPDMEVVGVAGGGHEGLSLAVRLGPDLVITDLRMDGGDGVGLLAALRERAPRIPVLVLTTYGTDEDLRPVLETGRGAPSILLKDAGRAELFDAVRATVQGRTVHSPAVTALLVDHYRNPPDTFDRALSPREVEVLGHLAEGRTNKEIGRALHISEATVKTHLVRMYGKLDSVDRASAVAAGYRLRLLPLDRTE